MIEREKKSQERERALRERNRRIPHVVVVAEFNDIMERHHAPIIVDHTKKTEDTIAPAGVSRARSCLFSPRFKISELATT